MPRLIRICNDTSMMHPWGMGDFAVGVGYPGSGIMILQCVGVNREETEETISMSYAMQEWPQDDTLGWQQLEDGDEK